MPAAEPGVRSAAPPVGQVVPLDRRVGTVFVDRARALLDDVAERNRLAEAVADERLAPDRWRATFARELAHVLRWAVGRLLHESPASPQWTGRGEVVALLPRHGHAVHALRRAVPFAACGVATVAAGHAAQAGVVADVAHRLADALGLRDHLRAADDPKDAVAGAGADDLVVVTGTVASAAAVRAATPALVLGATGRCAVAVADDRALLESATAALHRHDQPGSCTRWGGGWLGTIGSPRWSTADGSVVDVAATLTGAHPSVVYRVVHSLPPGLGSDVVAGYAVVACDGSGVTSTLVGFGRDPREGWPGDYLA
jgi:hypothetical protein